MTPGGRASAAIEVIEAIQRSGGTAEDLLRLWGRAHRFAGSKDRRAIADLVYVALRRRARSEARFGPAARGLVIGALDGGLDEAELLFSGEGHAPAPLSAAERAAFAARPDPDWARAGCPPPLAPLLEASLGPAWIDETAAAILERAPVDLRANSLCGPRSGAVNLLRREGVEPDLTPFSLLGLRLPPDYARDVHALRAFQTGWIEVQDEGSQLAAAALSPRAGEIVVDYCAGAGGKALAFAAAMRGEGRIIAADVDRRRLSAMDERIGRARARVERRLIGARGEGLDDLAGAADRVFVDAPCSGSGTWRRRPEAAWRLTPETLERLQRRQLDILLRAAGLVRPGGRLIYVTCSILRIENAGVVEAFERAADAFRPLALSAAFDPEAVSETGRARLAALAEGGHTVQLTPLRTGTDGFFIAAFERTERP